MWFRKDKGIEHKWTNAYLEKKRKHKFLFHIDAYVTSLPSCGSRETCGFIGGCFTVTEALNYIEIFVGHQTNEGGGGRVLHAGPYRPLQMMSSGRSNLTHRLVGPNCRCAALRAVPAALPECNSAKDLESKQRSTAEKNSITVIMPDHFSSLCALSLEKCACLRCECAMSA